MAYRIEYARSGRSGCKGPKPCAGTKIEKGALRLGTVVEIRGERSMFYRHWGCVTDKIVKNLQEKVGDPEDLDGYEDLKSQDQQKVVYAFTNGHIQPEDVTPALMEKEETAGESPKKAKAKKWHDDHEGDHGVVAADASKQTAKNDKPASKGMTKPKSEQNLGSELDELDASSEVAQLEGSTTQVAPAAKKRGRPSKALKEAEAQNAAVVANHSGAQIDDDDEGSADVQAAPKKRGRPPKASKTETDGANAAEEPAPNKRGRPPLTAHAEDDTQSAAAADESTDGPPAKKRGRPTKASKAKETADALPEGHASKPAEQLSSAAPVPKKRGRPPKSSKEEKTTLERPTVPPSSDQNGVSVQETPVDGNGLSKKKRGRPSKADLAAREAQLRAKDGAAPTASSDEPPMPSKKKRGRPSKADLAAREAQLGAQDGAPPTLSSDEPPMPSKKKRGRPSKADLAAREAQLLPQGGASPTTSTVDTSAPVKKKRGRPSKAATTAEAQVAQYPPSSSDAVNAQQGEAAVDANSDAVTLPKKRGRPKKEVDPNAVPKKRGRPKKDVNAEPANTFTSTKNIEQSDQEVESAVRGTNGVGSDVARVAEMPIKKVGRPKKADGETDREPKKRGRPKKVRSETGNDSSTAFAQSIIAASLVDTVPSVNGETDAFNVFAATSGGKRGRPSKAKDSDALTSIAVPERAVDNKAL